jgi:hypothetical protein
MDLLSSRTLSRGNIDRAVVEQGGIRVVAVHFEDFGNKAAAGPALNLDDDVEGIADVCLDGGVRELYSAL